MKPQSNKTLSALLITLVFVISTIGLPVMIVACPMESGSPAMVCCPQQTNQPGNNLRPLSAFGCCAKTIGTAPLKFESPELKSASNPVQKSKPTICLPSQIVLLSLSNLNSSSAVPLDGTLPLSEESYLFTSSLRI